MKRAPRPGEFVIEHITKNTGDTQSFAVCPENFDPFAVSKTSELIDSDVRGFRIVHLMVGDIGCSFTVNYNGLPVSTNKAMRRKNAITLETSILAAAARQTEEVLATLADLEQCAAIAFLDVEGYQ